MRQALREVSRGGEGIPGWILTRPAAQWPVNKLTNR